MALSELTEIDLPELSLRLGVSRERALRLAIAAGVRCRRDERGRWRIVAEDTQALQANANAQAASPHP